MYDFRAPKQREDNHVSKATDEDTLRQSWIKSESLLTLLFEELMSQQREKKCSASHMGLSAETVQQREREH